VPRVAAQATEAAAASKKEANVSSVTVLPPEKEKKWLFTLT
jgi:hypothetical protein